MTDARPRPGVPTVQRVRKRPSYWPTERSLFRDKGRRSVAATWIVWALSVASALLVAGYLRHPDI